MSKVLSLTGAQVTTLKSLLMSVNHLDDQQALILGDILAKLDKPTQSKPEFFTSNVDVEADTNLA